MPVFACFILILAYGVAAGFAGGSIGRQLMHDSGGPLRSAPEIYSGLLVIAVGVVLAYMTDHRELAWPLGLIGLSWAACRSIGMINDAATPDEPKEIATAFLRHALVALLAFAIGTYWHLPYLAPAVLAWAAIATLFAVWYAGRERRAIRKGVAIRRGDNRIVEIGQGLFIGLAIGIGTQPTERLAQWING